MACLPFICDPKVKRGLMPIGVNILLASVLLFRLVSSGCAVYALVLLNTDAALQTVHTTFVDTLYVFGRIPLGHMLVVITYSCACAMMPIQVLNSVLGLAGVVFTSRKMVYAHICMSFFTIPVMVVYAVLLAGGLHDFYYGIDDKFSYEINDGDHASDITTRLPCCGFSGAQPCLKPYWPYYNSITLPGCWDLWSSSFHNFLSTMLAFVISMLILEVLNLVITDYEYRKWRLKEEPKRSGNTGALPYIPRDAFGDICVNIVMYWRKGGLSFCMRCLAVCQGCVGVVLVVYGGYNISQYPSFVAEFSLQRLRFYNIYFNDLIRILASLLVLVGGTSLVASLQGVSMTCVRSRAAYYVSAFINIGSMVMAVTVIIFWGVFNTKVRADMEQEVQDLFYTALHYEPYLGYATNLVGTLQCCGIRADQDYKNLLPYLPYYYWDEKFDKHCSNHRPCAPVLQEHFRTFSGVGLALVSFVLLIQILSLLCVSKKVRELPVSESEPPIVRRGVIGMLKQRVRYLWTEDKPNGVGIALKIVTLLCGLGLMVTGLLLKFDDVFEDVDLYSLFYTLSFNNRRFTYYLVALVEVMLGLGATELAITLYGLVIYCWNSKFLEYILIVLRGGSCVVLIVMVGLCIESKSNIDWTMYDQLIREFKNFGFHHLENAGIAWKLLYFKMECCGIGNYGDFESVTLPTSRQIPIYCCQDVTDWKPDLDSGMENCTDSLLSGSFHETGCNDALLDRFGGYMITLFCFLSFLILFQVFDIVLSVRRIRILQPGNAIDKEIGILVKSVTGKCRDNKITDSNEVLVPAGSSESPSDQLPAAREDMKRNTVLPALDVDSARGLQPPPNTTTLPPETVGEPVRGRGRYRPINTRELRSVRYVTSAVT